MSTPKRIPGKSKPTRRRSGRGPVTQPGYHAGRVPPNKGRSLPTPILTREEISALFDAFRATRAVDVRDKALLWLAYRHGLKCVQLIAIDTSGYDPNRRELEVPPTARCAQFVISLDSMTVDMLDRWMVARKALGIRPFAPLFCTATADSLGQPVSPSYLRGKLSELGRSADLERRATIEGLRASGRAHMIDAQPSVEHQLERYVDADGFRSRHPRAYEKWADARVFFAADPKRYATQIGHNRREALAALANELVRSHQAVLEHDGGTVDKLRAVFATCTTSSTERRFLTLYWATGGR
jgi:hypothetical protein